MYILLLLVISLILLIIHIKLKLKQNKKQENFVLNMPVDSSQLLDSVQNFASNPSVNVVNKEIDDDFITNFITTQLGETKKQDENAFENTPLIDYPEEKVNDVSEKDSLEDIELVKQNYENQINIKHNNQAIKLKEILIQLSKINKLESKLKCK